MDTDPVISSQPKPAQGVAASDQYKESQQGAKSSDPVRSSSIPTEHAHLPIGDQAVPGIKLSPDSHDLEEQALQPGPSSGEQAAPENSTGLATEDGTTNTSVVAEQVVQPDTPSYGQAKSGNITDNPTEDTIGNNLTNPNAAPSINAETGSSEIGSDVIDVDSNLSDTDSALGSSVASSSVSLRDSIFEYIEEYGRTYHAYRSGAYHVPNDEAEQERLDLQHHLFRMTMDDKLYAAPVQKLHHVMDIATGTGIWAIEFAQEHPGTSVIGTDLSPIQPVYVPPNCQFFIDDCEDEWTYSQKFDLIHGRALLSCFSKPRTVMASIFNALAPNGYFELQDICFPCQSPDGTLEGTSLQKWQTLMVDGLRNLGKDFEKVKEYGNYMRDAGFVDIVEKKYTWAIGPWLRGRKQKMQAMWWQQNFLDGIHGWSMAIITRGMGWTAEEVEVLLVGVRNDVRNYRNIHAYVQMYVVYGRKP